MTNDEIIRMAREAGLSDWASEKRRVTLEEVFERFAAIVAQNYMAKACEGCVIKQCYKRMDAEIEVSVLAEREACAKVCEEYLTQGRSPLGKSVAAAIRARGDK